MTVATLTQPNYNTDSGSQYPANIDGAISVLKRLAGAYAPHEQSSPNMTVRLDAGFIFNGSTLSEIAAQSTGTITAPVGNPRIDRVVVDAVTGAVSVITGTPAGSPAAPALTAGKLPVAQVLLQTSSTTITNSMITDERIAVASNQPLYPEQVCQGRLTLTSGAPVTTGDVTAAETIYFTPFRGNKIALYDGVNWRLRAFTEISGDVPDANQMNDVFVYDNAGTLTLDIVAWTNDTTRATNLVWQDGVLVKSGATSRRYIGSFYGTTAGNGQTEDSVAKRYLWNYYNRVLKHMSRVESSSSWTYSAVDTYRQANASASNQIEAVIGVSEDIVEASVIQHCRNTSGSGQPNVTVGVGLNSTSTNSAQVRGGAINLTTTSTDWRTATATYKGYPGMGRWQLTWLEMTGSSGAAVAMYGTAGGDYLQSGMVGSVFC